MTTTAGIDTNAIRNMIEQAASEAFKAESATRSRPAHSRGMSSIGRCARQLGYVLSETPASDTPPDREGRAANLGTWEHEGLNPRIAEILSDQGARCETEVTANIAGYVFTGHVDIELDDGIIDLKTVGEHKLSKVRMNGPFAEHLLQIGAYALARLQAGRPVKWVALYYLDRANGEEEIFVIPITRALLLDVVERVTQIAREADNPDVLPRTSADGWANAGPGASFACNECHFLKHCWGPEAVPGEPILFRAKSFEDPEAHALLTEYYQVQQAESAAKRRKDEIKDTLAGMEPGKYTQPGQPTMSLTRGNPGQMFDKSRARALLEALGAEVPMVTTKGQTRVRAVKG